MDIDNEQRTKPDILLCTITKQIRACDFTDKCILCNKKFKSRKDTAEIYCGDQFHVQCLEQELTYKNCCPKRGIKINKENVLDER